MAEVKVVHTGDMQFRATNERGLETLMDASPEYGGGEVGMTPMENLLAALGGCSGMDVVTMLRNRHEEVNGYQINISGERAERHPKVFTHITMEHIVRGRNLTPAAVQHAVESSRDKYCSVLAMLKETAVIDVSWRIENE